MPEFLITVLIQV